MFPHVIQFKWELRDMGRWAWTKGNNRQTGPASLNVTLALSPSLNDCAA